MHDGSPWAYHLHVAAWVAVLALGVLYALAVRRRGWQATTRQVALFYGGLALLLGATTWPLADLAAHWLLSALVLQRLVLMLGAPPLLLLGLPVPVAAALTRPRLVDHVALACSRPKVAVVVVVLIAVGSLTAPAVHAQNSSLLWRAVFDTLILLSGIVLWTPVLRWVPGTTRPSPLARTAYLIIQSIVPSFLAIVWIFARHPLYPAYDYKGHVLGLSALGEQQIAGFVAKLGTIAVLWTVAFIGLARTEGEDPDAADPLTWADVQRHLERADRGGAMALETQPSPPSDEKHEPAKEEEHRDPE
jgi:putative membrane protein